MLTVFVNRLLSSKGFLPLGRLTFCVYLIHLPKLIIGTWSTPPCGSSSIITQCFEQFTTCFGLAFVAAVKGDASS